MVRRLASISYVQVRLTVVMDGWRALSYLRRRQDRDPAPVSLPHAVLLDLGLPGLTGLELLRRVKADETLRHIPVIVLTASEDERHMREGQELGAHSYLLKPMSPQDFSWIARSVGNYQTRLSKLAEQSRSGGT